MLCLEYKHCSVAMFYIRSKNIMIMSGQPTKNKSVSLWVLQLDKLGTISQLFEEQKESLVRAKLWFYFVGIKRILT